jgi:hypothetical protein
MRVLGGCMRIKADGAFHLPVISAQADRDRGGRYLTSNANISIYDEDGRSISTPIGDRYAKFETEL